MFATGTSLMCFGGPRTPLYFLPLMRSTAEVACGMGPLLSPSLEVPIHMALDMARLGGQIVDVLIANLAKYFDVIAQDVHPRNLLDTRLWSIRKSL